MAYFANDVMKGVIFVRNITHLKCVIIFVISLVEWNLINATDN